MQLLKYHVVVHLSTWATYIQTESRNERHTFKRLDRERETVEQSWILYRANEGTRKWSSMRVLNRLPWTDGATTTATDRDLWTATAAIASRPACYVASGIHNWITGFNSPAPTLMACVHVRVHARPFRAINKAAATLLLWSARPRHSSIHPSTAWLLQSTMRMRVGWWCGCTSDCLVAVAPRIKTGNGSLHFYCHVAPRWQCVS